MALLTGLFGGAKGPRQRTAGIEDRVLGESLHARPFPHLIADDVLPAHVLDDMLQNWPDVSCFETEVPGNYVCNPRVLAGDGTSRPEFWRGIAADVAPVLARACISRFAEWVMARYGDDFTDVLVGNFSLMQSDRTYPGHPCHAHHWHDPLWIMTALLYIDADPGGQQGTTLNAFVIPGGVDAADYAARFAAEKPTASTWHGSTWDPSQDMSELRTSEYKANRLVAFLDSPISYHSVRPVPPGTYGARRLLRMHLGAPWSYCESLYGVSYQEYRAKRELATDDPQVIGWLRRDVSQMWATTPSLSAGARRKWARGLRLDF